MVQFEILTLLGAAGIGVIGILVGRMTKKTTKKVETKIKRKKIPMHFVAIAGEVDPSSLVEIAQAGEPVFINLKPLRTSPMVRTRFLNSLGKSAKSNQLQLSEVTKELVLLTDGKQLIRVKTLTEISEFNDDSAVRSALNKVATVSPPRSQGTIGS